MTAAWIQYDAAKPLGRACFTTTLTGGQQVMSVQRLPSASFLALAPAPVADDTFFWTSPIAFGLYALVVVVVAVGIRSSKSESGEEILYSPLVDNDSGDTSSSPTPQGKFRFTKAARALLAKLRAKERAHGKKH